MFEIVIDNSVLATCPSSEVMSAGMARRSVPPARGWIPLAAGLAVSAGVLTFAAEVGATAPAGAAGGPVGAGLAAGGQERHASTGAQQRQHVPSSEWPAGRARGIRLRVRLSCIVDHGVGDLRKVSRSYR